MIFNDLPRDLVGDEIFARIPMTSSKEVRSTCKLWNALSRECVLGKAATKSRQFVGFMMMDMKVCSMRFHVRKGEVSVNQVESLKHVEIYQVHECDGLLLCITEDNSRLVMWNPYLGQIRWINPKSCFDALDRYAVGYDKKSRNHKILRFVDDNDEEENHVFEFEIYDLSSDSWRVLEVTPDWDISFDQRGASLKGDTYFFAQEKRKRVEGVLVIYVEHFLICFDFTKERFGPRLPLPFHCYGNDAVALSCVGEERLAVLYQDTKAFYTLEIWVTTMIEPEAVSWMKFLKLDERLVTSVGPVQFRTGAGSFFIDEEEKTAVVFDLDGHVSTGNLYNTAFIFGGDGYFKYVSLGDAPTPNIDKEPYPPIYCPPLVCSSSYRPSLVQINKPTNY